MQIVYLINRGVRARIKKKPLKAVLTIGLVYHSVYIESNRFPCNKLSKFRKNTLQNLFKEGPRNAVGVGDI